MGQVPKTNSYLIVGNGRLARHLARYFQLESIPFQTCSRKANSPQELAALLSESLSVSDRRVLVAVRDDAIETLIKEYAPGAKPEQVIHFSGSLVTPLASGIHPLFTFATELYSLDVYRSIPFVSEKGKTRFHEAFPELKNPSYQIDPREKPLYHALCVIGGNFTTLLWRKFYREMKKLGIDQKAGQAYMERIFANLIDNPEGALTGPLQRNDQKTIDLNLGALEGDPYHEVYQSFVRAVRMEVEA